MMCRVVGMGVGVLLAIELTGCAWWQAVQPENVAQPPETYQEVMAHFVPDADVPVSAPARDDRLSGTQLARRFETAIQRYLDVRPLLDERSRRGVDLKLAELHRQRLELEVGDGVEETPAYRFWLDKTIAQYEALADQTVFQRADSEPEAAAGASVHYQLARLYDWAGNAAASTRHLNALVTYWPGSALAAEAWLRLGERAFSAHQYEDAVADFTQVVRTLDSDDSAQPALIQQARYMLAWSLFRRGEYQSAVDAGLHFLDEVWRRGPGPWSAAKQRQIEDVFRLIGLSWDALGGIEAHALVRPRLSAAAYTPRLFHHYMNAMERAGRKDEAVAACRAFVDHWSNNPFSLEFVSRLVDLEAALGDAGQVRARKRHYLKMFEFHRTAWSDESRSHLAAEYGTEWVSARQEEAKRYLGDLALWHYTQAAGAASGEQGRAHYLKAADWYRHYVDWFPHDARRPHYEFLWAESLYAAASYEEAARRYRAIVQQSEIPYAPEDRREAAYGWIASLGHLGPSVSQALVEAEKEFVTRYPKDKRALAVHSDVLKHLQARNDHVGLKAWSQSLLKAAEENRGGWAAAELDVAKRNALSFYGNALLEEKDWAALVTWIPGALDAVTWPENKKVAWNRLLGRSWFELARAQEGQPANGLALALESYRKVLGVPAAPAVRREARREVIRLLMETARWNEAADALSAYLDDYPKEAQAEHFASRLAWVLEQGHFWARAARAWEKVPDSELAASGLTDQQRWWHVATLYEQANDWGKAIHFYRFYAHRYPNPASWVMQAREKLIRLYQARGEEEKKRYWQNQVIADFFARRENMDEESARIARRVLREQVEQADRLFGQGGLNVPLKASLAKKQRQMRALIRRLEQLADIGSEDDKSLSVFLTGRVYQRLARQLMASPRPKGLTALEKEQYEILLEDMAFPFEEKAIEILEINWRRLVSGRVNAWTLKSLDTLKVLLPARYARQERLDTFYDLSF